MAKRYQADFTISLRVEWDADPDDADLVLQDQAHNALTDQLPSSLCKYLEHNGASNIEEITAPNQ